uniref:Putative UDP-rhamnose:rhamnosyltransferase 1 n=1 Tax=Anthurium amnicola TaxID=1678845 RepID=A0A1D1XLY6_9ARAE
MASFWFSGLACWEMEKDGGLHIAVLPWLALGHLLPCFELSKRIAAKGHRVSFLSTPRNIRRLLPDVPPRLAPLLNLVELPLPRVEHLPDAAEATIDLPSQDLRPYLRVAYDALEHPLCEFLEGAHHRLPPVDWIVFDYSPYWVPRVAARFGVPCAYLGLFSAAALAFHGPPSALIGGDDSRTTPEQFTVPPEWIPFPSTIAYRGYEARELFEPGIQKDASGVSESYRFGASVGGCQLVAIRSCPDLEPNWLSLLGNLYQKPVVPLGLLPPSAGEDSLPADDRSCHGWKGVFEWLDTQQPASAVYVAFGSEAKLSCGQVHQIALGLEQSGLPFVWALRKPSDEPDELKMLPTGFRERMNGRGIVCVGWLPQVKILAHPSVAGFFTHGGWNSVVEGLALGRAFVLLPLMFDQGLNSRDLVERGIGLEVPRDEADGTFTGDAISKTLRLVFADERGETFRAKAREAKSLFGNTELQDHHLSHFVEYLVDHRRPARASPK